MEPYSESTSTTSPTALFIHLSHAKQVGPNRHRGFCSYHPDHNPSLDVSEGRNGCCLLICRAGCRTEDVVRAFGREMRDLFCGGLSREEIRAAQRQAEQEHQQRRRGHHAACIAAREVRVHERLVERLAATLARTRDDDPRLPALTKAFHLAISQLHIVEMALAVIDVTVYGKAL